MINFVLNIVLFAALGAVIYLFARTLPRIDDTKLDPAKEDALAAHLTSSVEKLDSRLKSLFEKILRKVRLIVLKVDNAIGNKIGKLKKEKEKEGESIFKEAAGEDGAAEKNGEK